MEPAWPVRCITCGKPFRGNRQFIEQVLKNVPPDVILDQLGLVRPCCRARVFCAVDSMQLRLEEHQLLIGQQHRFSVQVLPAASLNKK